MQNIAAIVTLFMALSLAGCQNKNAAISTVSTEIQELQNINISESIANKEYYSIEDFQADSNESFFALNPQKTDSIATSSNASVLNTINHNVSVSSIYISVNYECEAGRDSFQLSLTTYLSNNGEKQLDSVISSNPGIFTEKEIAGIPLYYCPGSPYDWFDCYAMVINEKMLVVNIEQGYDEYIEDVLNNLILQQ